MVSVTLVQKTLQSLKTTELQQLARENGLKVNSKMTRGELVNGLLQPWRLWLRGGGRTLADLPEPALEKIFKQMSRADIDQLRIASPPLYRRLKQLEESGKTYLKEVIASRPRVIRGHDGSVMSVAWNPDGKRLASGSADGTVRIWEAETGEQIRDLGNPVPPLWDKNNYKVRSVAWSPDGKRLASAGENGDRATSLVKDDNSIRIWDAETGKQIGEPLSYRKSVFGLPLSGHNQSVESVAWSPDGSKLASGSEDRTVLIWDAKTGEEIGHLWGHTFDETDRMYSVAWSPDGTRLASSSARMVRIWNAETREYIRDFGEHDGKVYSVAWSPDGKRLASGSVDTIGFDWESDDKNTKIPIWDTKTGEKIRDLVVLGDQSDLPDSHDVPYYHTVISVAWSPDGKRLASGSRDGTVRIWEAETGEQIKVLRGHDGTVESVAWSPDGKRLVSGGEDRTIRIWTV